MKKKTFWIILAIFFALLFIASALLLLRQCGYLCGGDTDTQMMGGRTETPSDLFSGDNATENSVAPTEGVTDESQSDVPEPTELPVILPDNPIDFLYYWNYNPDVYAWIEVPGTPIDYPILQSSKSSDYYHRRNWLGESNAAGCIYTQYYNRKDMTDPNTVIYGHYMWNGTFFGSLHNFRDRKFFDENRYIYIYIPGHALKYEIFAAYEYDNRHILGAYNFANKDTFLEYLNSCLNPQTLSRNVLEGVEFKKDDRIVTLSTCLANGDSSKRYLVQGVLIEDVRTK